jgi:hypothetical protein
LWVFPFALGVVLVGFLCWGAWRTGYDPGWLARGRGFWVSVLRPGQEWALPVTVGLWLAVLALYWWPRRRQLPVGLAAVAVMVALAVVLGTASFVPCRDGLSAASVVFWVLQLFVGQPPPVYPGSAVCTGAPPQALQVAQVLGLAATLTGALAAGSALWRPPVDRLRSLLTRQATVFTGLDPLTIPLLGRLAETAGSLGRVIVIEPDQAHPLLDAARATGARVITGAPASPALLGPVIAGWRGPALGHLYALRSDDDENQAVLLAARQALGRYQSPDGGHPHLVVRIDDPLHASYWRASRNQPGTLVVEDAISVAESTARALAGMIAVTRPRSVLLCGSGHVSLALLLELARRSWEEAQLLAAATAGREAWDAEAGDGSATVLLPPLPAVIPVERIALLDPRCADVRRRYLQVAAPTVIDAAPVIVAHPVRWQEHLLRTLDSMPLEAAHRTAVVMTEVISGADVHEVERIAALHPETPIFTQLPPGTSRAAAAFYGLHLFSPGLLVDGEVPEDTWTRIARHWHETYRLSRPLPPEHPRAAARVPWADLDPFLRQDNILMLHSVMSAVAATGRLWVPAQMVPEGSFIELSEREAGQVAEAEFTRWKDRRLAAGRTGKLVVPWRELPSRARSDMSRNVSVQIAQLEDAGFLPVVPVGGPPGAITVEHAGTVTASQLETGGPRTLLENQQQKGSSGDWHLTSDDGEPETMTDSEFRSSHEPAGDGKWRRAGTLRAWQVTEKTVIRAREGKTTGPSPRGDGRRFPVVPEARNSVGWC